MLLDALVVVTFFAGTAAMASSNPLLRVLGLFTAFVAGFIGFGIAGMCGPGPLFECYLSR